MPLPEAWRVGEGVYDEQVDDHQSDHGLVGTWQAIYAEHWVLELLVSNEAKRLQKPLLYHCGENGGGGVPADLFCNHLFGLGEQVLVILEAVQRSNVQNRHHQRPDQKKRQTDLRMDTTHALIQRV